MTVQNSATTLLQLARYLTRIASRQPPKPSTLTRASPCRRTKKGLVSLPSTQHEHISSLKAIFTSATTYKTAHLSITFTSYSHKTLSISNASMHETSTAMTHFNSIFCSFYCRFQASLTRPLRPTYPSCLTPLDTNPELKMAQGPDRSLEPST